MSGAPGPGLVPHYSFLSDEGGLGPVPGEVHCLCTTSINSLGEGITSAVVVSSENRESIGSVASKAGSDTVESGLRRVIFRALKRRDVNRADLKSPVKAGWSSSSPSSSESSASFESDDWLCPEGAGE